MLGVAFWLFLLALGNLSIHELLEELSGVRYSWIYLSIGIAILSHWLRAYRWNMLLEPLGYKRLTSFKTFLAVMSGYLANMAVPRMGEITRCGILKKTDGVPVTTSLGTVITERLLDALVLLLLLALTLILDYEIIKEFTVSFFSERFASLSDRYHTWFNILVAAGAVLGAGGVIGLFLLVRYKERLKKRAALNKLLTLIEQGFEGILSIRKVKNVPLFILLTMGIWFCYYMMSFLAFRAIPETAHLSWIAGLSVFTFGGVGMVLPAPGGLGTYHVIVKSVLQLYHVKGAPAVLFATVVHAAQSIMFVVIGGLSIFVSVFISKKKKNENEKHTHRVKNMQQR